MPRKKTASKKKKTTCSAIGSRKKFNGKNFTLKKKPKSMAEAKKFAKNHRSGGKGKYARVVKTKSCGIQVFTYG